MPEAAYSSIMTAVAVFQDVKPFQAAIDDLLTAGFTMPTSPCSRMRTR